ncbi:uncharacterized protein LOC129592186 [Paramacrobiotus metropolitanus]|uniref:uncharacterized protein LOC129592186 n=1 Tax=Paramacrobiotus metropolitanus TaxID=2943436 RepID=UPI0024465B2C|nr:uncharacterized protein LOC129592186 [Paramacrobiotus metropolitanus]
MYTHPVIVLYISVFSVFLEQVSCLKCKECDSPDQPQCPVVKDRDCGPGFDACVTFTGNFVDQSGKSFAGNTVRSCGTLQKLQLISKDIGKDRCTNVNNAKDPETGSTFSGRFCLCSSELCNATGSSSMVMYSMFTVLTCLLLAGLISTH